MEPDEKIRLRDAASQIVASLSMSIVAMLVGYSNGYSSPAEHSMLEDLDMTIYEFSWVTSIMPLFAIFGPIIGAPLIQYVGRKWTVLISDLLALVSFLLIATAKVVWMLYIARALVGLGVSINNLATPVYLGEATQARIRGTLTLFPTISGNSGIVVVYFAGRYLRWNGLAWLGFLISVPFVVLVFVIPETPVFYMTRGEKEKSLAALKWLRGEDVDLNKEFAEMEQLQREQEEKKFDMKDFFSILNLRPLLIGVGLMFFQQFSGINAVIYYTEAIFKMAGSSVDKNTCSIIVGFVNVVATILATVLVDKLGRRMLLFMSAGVMILTLAIFGVHFHITDNGKDLDKGFGWLPLLCLVVYVMGFSLGYGPVPWLMMGEIMPTKTRAADAAVVTCFNWFGAFVVTKTFYGMVTVFGASVTFWVYAVFVAVSIPFTLIFVPETKGRTLLTIEKDMAARNA